MTDMDNTFKNPAFSDINKINDRKEKLSIFFLDHKHIYQMAKTTTTKNDIANDKKIMSFSKNKYESILFEINLPDFEGFELNKTIRATPEGELLLIIQLSSSTDTCLSI